MNNKIKVKTVALIALAMGMCLLAAAWHWTSMSEWLDVNALAGWLKTIRNEPSAPWIVLAAYLIGSQIMFPITVLILATAYAFGPWLGFAYAMIGSVLGALVTYGFGYWIGKDGYRRLFGSRFEAVDQALRGQGLAAVIATHLLPVGPFTFVNLGAGVVGVRVWEFILGCAIGMLPGITLTTFFERQLELVFQRAGLLNAVLLAGAGLTLLGFMSWAQRRLKA